MKAWPQRLLWFAIFLAVATVCSLPRFGQRENERLPWTDSDLYIDMARVFTGAKAQFEPEWVNFAPHHYNRPLFPFVAGWMAKLALRDNLRAAFSIVNIVAAASVALIFFEMLRRYRPGWRFHWLAPVCFLAGFPQLNWGYHILTDTVGLATAFALAACVHAVIVRVDAARNIGIGEGAALLAAVLALSSIAFLARETAWIAVVSTFFLLFVHRSSVRVHPLFYAALVALLLAGKIPHMVYADAMHVRGVPLRPRLSVLLELRYLADFIVKTGVCFNFAWLVALAGLFRHRAAPPLFFTAWTLGALLYAGAGYAANSAVGTGFPMRMSYPLFPLVLFWALALFQTPARARAAVWLSVFLVVQTATNFVGVALDPATGKITVSDLWQAVQRRFQSR